MQSCGNKAHAILKLPCLNAPDFQIFITQSGSFKTVHKPVQAILSQSLLAKESASLKKNGPFGGTALCGPFLTKHTLDQSS